MNRRGGDTRRRGFTLVQLAAVLAVIVIISAVVVADFIATRRVRLAERGVREMTAVLDAARWFYVNSSADPTQQRWPGYNGGNCSARAGEDPYDILRGSGQLANLPAPLIDPWGNAYTAGAQLINVPAWGRDLCVFEIRTAANSVPASVQNVFVNNLPRLGLGTDCAGGICMGRIPPPGFEAVFRGMDWTPPNPDCVPNCAGRNCGPDPVCGESCGGCAAGDECSPLGVCQCVGICVNGEVDSTGCPSPQRKECGGCRWGPCVCPPGSECNLGASEARDCDCSGNASPPQYTRSCQSNCTWSYTACGSTRAYPCATTAGNFCSSNNLYSKNTCCVDTLAQTCGVCGCGSAACISQITVNVCDTCYNNVCDCCEVCDAYGCSCTDCNCRDEPYSCNCRDELRCP
jgi:hypothetical protein